MPGHQAARLRIKSITYAFCLSIDEWQKRHNSLFYLNLLCHSPAWLLEIQPHSLLVFFAHHSNPEQVISNPLFVLPWSQILILWWLLADRHMEGVCVFARIKGFVPWPQAWTVMSSAQHPECVNPSQHMSSQLIPARSQNPLLSSCPKLKNSNLSHPESGPLLLPPTVAVALILVLERHGIMGFKWARITEGILPYCSASQPQTIRTQTGDFKS